MLRVNDWAVDADDRCYVVGKLKTRKNKDGAAEEYIAAPRYFSTMGQALSAILESERRTLLADGEYTIASLQSALEKSDRELMALLGGATNAE